MSDAQVKTLGGLTARANISLSRLAQLHYV
jgi:hypothetical protein